MPDLHLIFIINLRKLGKFLDKAKKLTTPPSLGHYFFR